MLLALVAQLVSGAAAVVNQTVWQRALIVHVAGSEALSSMIVVLVFMAGLGAGSLWMGRTAGRIANPARALAMAELLLAAANLLIVALLSLDPGDDMRRLQLVALSFGVPLPLLDAAVSGAVLIAPCFLMGVTSPLMSETAQRQLRQADSRFLVVLFFGNTLGSFAGGLATGFLLLPLFGQRASLATAIALNTIAGAMLAWVSRKAVPDAPRQRTDTGGEIAPRPARLDGLAFSVGLLALAYEMYLYRAVGLTFEPKPFTFATVLCFYLLFWAVGVLLARWLRWALRTTLLATSASTLIAPLLASLPWPAPLRWPHALLALGFWAPCIGFGIAFGQLVIRVSQEWGRDVGRFYGWNTIGSCAGIVFGVLLGYRMHPTHMLLAISGGYLLLAFGVRFDPRPVPSRRRVLLVLSAVTLGLMTAIVWLERQESALQQARGDTAYFGPEGVVEVRGRSAVFWNGLGHATMSHDDNHLGGSNWQLGALPLLAHAPAGKLDALVVGLGGGVTVGTLARSEMVRTVDVYEINPRLRQLLADYPTETLGVGTNPKIRLLWRDGRTGLAVSEKKYDVATQQPLYLKQAGSSVLLSLEYMRLVRSRLKPGAVFAIYSNSQGHSGQERVVRQTARAVFRHVAGIASSYMLLVSDQPITLTRESIERFVATAPPGDVFAAEVRKLGVSRIAAMLDRPVVADDERPLLGGDGGPLLVTDDQPIVEYPALLDRLQSRSDARRARRQ